MSVKIEGLDGAMDAMQAAFPKSYKIQAQIINGSMGGAARKTIMPLAKQMAKASDSSGALSESIGVRAQKARQRRGKAGGMMVVPVRFNKKALATYIAYYYTRLGNNAPAGTVARGITHGHQVEFGNARESARPFLWPAAAAGKTSYIARFAIEMKKRVVSRVKREAKKAKR